MDCSHRHSCLISFVNTSFCFVATVYHSTSCNIHSAIWSYSTFIKSTLSPHNHMPLLMHVSIASWIIISSTRHIEHKGTSSNTYILVKVCSAAKIWLQVQFPAWLSLIPILCNKCILLINIVCWHC